jgi:hypothetical protein
LIKVAVRLPGEFEDAGDFLANVRALEAAGADMIVVEGDWAVAGAIAAVTERLRMLTGGSPPESLRRLSRGRAASELPAGERWVEVTVPPDREGWISMLREHEASGATGVIAPWEPRLIDLLRNPEPDDRTDLLMSTG